MNIPYTTLDCFKQNYSDQSDLMCEMLKHWLKAVIDTPPSWEAVVTALRSPAVNEKKVAEQLELKYCTPVQLVKEEFHSPTKVEISEGIIVTCKSTLSCMGARGLRQECI